MVSFSESWRNGLFAVAYVLIILASSMYFNRLKWPAAIAAVLGVSALVVAGTNGELGLSVESRVALGVGGLSIAGVAVGLSIFESVRSAASVGAAILVIGVLTFPGATDLAGDHVGTVVGWMAALIGAGAVAEAAVQTSKAKALAEATSDEARSQILGLGGDT